MSDLLNQASLVMVPSGYKEDTVYSVVPSDGSGDLSFTRASNGTRINSAGLVEVCPWNLLSNSEQFTSANGWFPNVTGSATSSQTSDYGVAPNGTTTADRIQLALNGAAYADWVVVPTTGIIVGQVYTYSIYMKSLSGTKTIKFFNDASMNVVKTITTEWVRYDYTWTATSATIYPRFLIDSSGDTSTTADLLAWGFQINSGALKPYFPTTDRLNVPRLTYQNGGGGCPSLLLEKQSTNLLTWSEDFTQTDWVASNLTITANDATSPDGTQNAEKFTTLSTSAENQARQGTFSILGNVGSSYTTSVYAKKGTANYLRIRNLFVQNGDTLGNAWFNLNTGAVGTVQSSQTASIQNMGNGWYRCILTGIVGSSNNYNFVDIGFSDGETNIPTTSVNGYVWGAQLE